MNFNALDLNLLKVFDALMRERSVTRAASRLNLSQPAVSSALNRLRRQLGDKLFLRQSNQMVPTARALALWEVLRHSLDGIKAAMAEVEPFDPVACRRTFRIMGSDYFSNLLMPRLARECLAEAPGISLRLVDNSFGAVDELLAADRIDFACERPVNPVDWMGGVRLLGSDFVAIAAADNPELTALPGGPGRVIPAELFCSLPHALRSVDGSDTGYVDTFLKQQGLSRRVVLTLPHFHAVARAVAHSGIIAALPRSFANVVAPEFGLAVYELPVGGEAQDIFLYWHKRYDSDLAHSWLRERIVSICAAFQVDAPTVPA